MSTYALKAYHDKLFQIQQEALRLNMTSISYTFMHKAWRVSCRMQTSEQKDLSWRLGATVGDRSRDEERLSLEQNSRYRYRSEELESTATIMKSAPVSWARDVTYDHSLWLGSGFNCLEIANMFLVRLPEIAKQAKEEEFAGFGTGQAEFIL